MAEVGFVSVMVKMLKIKLCTLYTKTFKVYCTEYMK